MNTLRGLILFLLAIIGLGWCIVISDVHTSMAYSNSFAWLSPETTTSIVYGSIGMAAIAVCLAIVDLLFQKNRKYVSAMLLIASIALVPALWIYTGRIADTTEPAVLQNK
jgi:magnesium-transporting ATPase (P-type)